MERLFILQILPLPKIYVKQQQQQQNGNNSTCWPGFFTGIFCILIFCITSFWFYLTYLQHQGTTNFKCLK